MPHDPTPPERQRKQAEGPARRRKSAVGTVNRTGSPQNTPPFSGVGCGSATLDSPRLSDGGKLAFTCEPLRHARKTGTRIPRALRPSVRVRKDATSFATHSTPHVGLQ